MDGRAFDEVNLSEYELWNAYFPRFRATVGTGVYGDTTLDMQH